MHVSKITAEAFNASIEKALNNIPDAEGSIKKIQKILNGLPNGKVFTSVRDGNAYFYTVVDGKQRYISKKSKKSLFACCKPVFLAPHAPFVLSFSRRTKRESLATNCMILSRVASFE